MISQIVKQAFQQSFLESKKLVHGELASYIPELSKVDPELYSAALVDVDGDIFELGDSEQLFSMQSTSKPFLYSIVAQELGFEEIHSRVGVEPTGEAFNSIIELEEKSHRPFNPMINSGAIATTSMVSGENFEARWQRILSFFSELAGVRLSVDESIFQSERQTAHRNRAIAYLMKHFKVMTADIEPALDLYFRQCSILTRARDIAVMAATLANRGRQPLTGSTVVSEAVALKTLSLMFSCGMYDTAGEWAFKVGFPAKSGVSGVICMVVPGKFGMAIYSPRVDSHGHSIRACQMLELFVNKLNINIFNPASLQSHL